MTIGLLYVKFTVSNKDNLELCFRLCKWFSFHITMTSHERHVVSNCRSFHCLFNSLCGHTSKKHLSPHYFFTRDIHQWPVNSPHKGPLTRKKIHLMTSSWIIGGALRWRHNGRDGVSNHQPHDCLLNRLFRRRSKKTSKLRVTGLCAGNSPGPVNSPHKWSVSRKMFPFDDVIMGV